MGTRHQPHSARSCELALRAVGGARERPGGAPVACVWGVGGRALSHARLSVLGACGRGPLPTGCGCGGDERRDSSPTPLRALLRADFSTLAQRHVGTSGGRLLPTFGASEVGRSATPNRPSLGRAAGAHYPLAVAAGDVGVGILHQPHSARSYELALALWGRHEGAPGGAPLACVWGVRGRALSQARPPVLGACTRGRLPTGCGCGWGGLRDSSPTPLRALLRADFVRLRGGTWAPGAGVSCLRVGCPGSGALPRSTASPRGVQPGPAVHWLWEWGPVTNPTARAPASWLCALCGRHEGARRERLLPACGASGVGRSPTPDRLSLGGAAGAHYPLAVGAGGLVSNPTARAVASWLCALWLGHQGARGVRLLSACRASGVGRSPTPDRPSLGRAAGARYALALGAVCGLGPRLSFAVQLFGRFLAPS